MIFYPDLQASDQRGLRDDAGRGPCDGEATLPRDLRHRGPEGRHVGLRGEEEASLEGPVIAPFCSVLDSCKPAAFPAILKFVIKFDILAKWCLLWEGAVSGLKVLLQMSVGKKPAFL